MNRDEKQKVLIALMQINIRNRDNRITDDLANGISASMGEFLDTMLVVQVDEKKETETSEES